MPADRTLTFVDIFDAWAGAREYGSKNPDLSEHHTRRYVAFSKAFGVDLNSEPADAPPAPEWAVETLARFGRGDGAAGEGWHEWVHRLALQTAEGERSVHSPFSGYLEARSG